MTETNNKPNMLWIFADQMRLQATGYMADPNLHTPNLDRLAAEGICSTQAVAGTPLCCPYRGSLLTSRYPHKVVPGHQYPLPTDQATIAHVYNEAGYQTAYFGKWHLDGFDEADGRAAHHIVPPERRGGFQTWLGYENNNSPWDCWVHGGGTDQAHHYRLPDFESDALTDLLIEHLKGISTQQPFFTALSLQPPHDPYIAPEAWMQRHTPGGVRLRNNVPDIPEVRRRAQRDLAGYYAMIENLDWNIGRIRQALAEANLADNTHIIFFSDHGDMHGSHGQFRKTSPWEESIRVPFIMAGQQAFYQHQQGHVPLLVNHVDIAPTSLGLCDLEVPEWMEGTDYSAYRLKAKAHPQYPESAFLQLPIATSHHNSIDRPWRGVVTKDGWKYVVLEHQPWLMFNLNDDPYEQMNLAHNTAYNSQRQQLQALLTDWLQHTGDSFALPQVDQL